MMKSLQGDFYSCFVIVDREFRLMEYYLGMLRELKF